MKFLSAVAAAMTPMAFLGHAVRTHVVTQAEKTSSYGPGNCVTLDRSSAGSCVIRTNCDDVDVSQFEFAFDCQNTKPNGEDSVVRHSFGVGGFDTQEEFDTEVPCAKCAAPPEMVAAPMSLAHTEQPKAPAVVPPLPGLVPKKVQARTAANFYSKKAEARTLTNLNARMNKPKEDKDKEDKEDKVADDKEQKGKPEAPVITATFPTVKYGPDGCVQTYKSEAGHCIMKTNCSAHKIKDYNFGLICVDKKGGPVRHLFGKASFDPEETFDTLINCEQCMGLEDIPDGVAMTGQVMALADEIGDLKGMMLNMTRDIEKLDEKVFPEESSDNKTNVASPSAPTPSPSAPAPSAAAPAPAVAVNESFIVHSKPIAHIQKRHKSSRSLRHASTETGHKQKAPRHPRTAQLQRAAKASQPALASDEDDDEAQADEPQSHFVAAVNTQGHDVNSEDDQASNEDDQGASDEIQSNEQDANGDSEEPSPDSLSNQAAQEDDQGAQEAVEYDNNNEAD